MYFDNEKHTIVAHFTYGYSEVVPPGVYYRDTNALSIYLEKYVVWYNMDIVADCTSLEAARAAVRLLSL
jgi:GT2 family glycosyltransferase